MKNQSKHILYINDLSELNPKKDSSLLLAATLKQKGFKTYLLFEKDLSWDNKNEVFAECFNFEAEIGEDFYLKDFKLTTQEKVKLDATSIFHMRIDPPFDGRYLRYQWLLIIFELKNIKVVNSPKGVLQFNEKLLAYEHQFSLPSLIGNNCGAFKLFVEQRKSEGDEFLIMKPLDLFQGIGVEKYSLTDPDLEKKYLARIEKENGNLVVQKYATSVHKGETRAIFYKGVELGSILKLPKDGEFLANIAQGATFKAAVLSPRQRGICEYFSIKMMEQGVPWLAFDLLGDYVSEVNITCPGLLVEVSKAHHKNLAEKIIELGF